MTATTRVVPRNVTDLLRFFGYEHLPTDLANASRPFCVMATKLVHDAADCTDEPDWAELVVAIRWLLLAKDAAVRARIPRAKETTS